MSTRDDHGNPGSLENFTKLSFKERNNRSFLCYTIRVNFGEEVILMKKKLLGFMAVLMIMALALCGCGGGSEEAAEADVSAETDTEAVETDTAGVVKTFDEIDTEDMDDLPLQLESVTLYDDGSIRVIPTDEVKEVAETNDELEDGAAYPFKDAGKAEDIYLVRFGNGGYRTVIALMDDGTIAALSAKDLIEDKILVVMPHVSNRDDFVSIEERTTEDAFTVIGITKEGDEVELDYSLDF